MFTRKDIIRICLSLVAIGVVVGGGVALIASKVF